MTTTTARVIGREAACALLLLRLPGVPPLVALARELALALLLPRHLPEPP